MVLQVFIASVLVSCVAGESQCHDKTELDACLASVSPHMPRSGLPHDRKQLNNMCRAFKGGMACVDKYTHNCMSQVERDSLESHLKGARSTLAFLCDDPVFQKEYLSHGVCIRDVKEDWDRCHYHFKQLVSREHSTSNNTQKQRDHNICCIREGFLRCVYWMSYLKCGKLQAIFLQKMTATLSYSDVHQEKCRNVTISMCSKGVPNYNTSILLVIGSTLYLYFSLVSNSLSFHSHLSLYIT